MHAVAHAAAVVLLIAQGAIIVAFLVVGLRHTTAMLDSGHPAVLFTYGPSGLGASVWLRVVVNQLLRAASAEVGRSSGSARTPRRGPPASSSVPSRRLRVPTVVRQFWRRGA